MSLDHAILGFLNYNSLSGYDLKAAFDASVNHFWPADQSQIYRTLSRLADKGYANIEVVEQEDRPDRKVYHITATGKEELHRWLTSDLQSGGERIAELIQIFFAGGLTDEEILVMLRRLADRYRACLEVLRMIPEEAKAKREISPTRDCFFWGLTLEYGLHITEAGLNWLEDVIVRVERGDHMKGE